MQDISGARGVLQKNIFACRVWDSISSFIFSENGIFLKKVCHWTWWSTWLLTFQPSCFHTATRFYPRRPNIHPKNILFPNQTILNILWKMLVEEPSRNPSIPMDSDCSNRFYTIQKLYYDPQVGLNDSLRPNKHLNSKPILCHHFMV